MPRKGAIGNPQPFRAHTAISFASPLRGSDIVTDYDIRSSRRLLASSIHPEGKSRSHGYAKAPKGNQVESWRTVKTKTCPGCKLICSSTRFCRIH